MNVLVTGARGFIGRNLCESLHAIRDGLDRRVQYNKLLPLQIYECDLDTPLETLSLWCSKADFVLNFAGVNRPVDSKDFVRGNHDFLALLLRLLELHGNRCPIMLSSSVQATLSGRYSGSEYGRSKLMAEACLRDYGVKTGTPVFIYRFPNVYGKWCRPNYNSVVATFCDAIANGRDYHVDDSSTELELLFIDDLVASMLDLLLGNVCPDEDGFCHAEPTNKATLGKIVSMLEGFRNSRASLLIPDQTRGSFSKKLHATFLSYHEPGALAYELKANRDERGAFTEFVRTKDKGQVSVNVCKPGMTKGNHWHHEKWEKFLVVSGNALIRLRRVGVDDHGLPFPVDEYHVNGDEPTVVEMAPGMAHSIENLSMRDDLVTVIWASEPFDPVNPDTFYEEV